MLLNPLVRLFAVMLFGLCTFAPALAADGQSSPHADLTQGAHDWTNNCARCHNLRSASEFTPNQWQVIMQHMRIQCGLTGQEARNVGAFMMAQSAPATAATTTTVTASTASTINTKQLAQATGTVLAANTKPGTPAPAATAVNGGGQSGSAVYHQTCIACHGANGKGAIPGAPDFTSSSGPLSKSDAVLMQHIINGFQAPGNPMAMPPRGGNPKLTDEDLKNALAYIRQTFKK